MSMSLAAELRGYGYKHSDDEFRELLYKTFCEMYPDWTDSKLLYHPIEGMRLAAVVCSRAKCKFPDEFVLRHLENLRKGGWIKKEE